jgi:vancomycin resistance protein VanJ
MSLPNPSSFRTSLTVLGMFCRAMTGAYALSILLYLLLRLLIGEDWILVSFVSSFMPALILPALILLPMTLLLRQWQLSLMLIPAVIFFGITWGSFFLPQEIPLATANEQTVKILSYNIYSNRRNPEMIIDVIRQADADIVALQELGFPQAAAIEAALTDIYPYMALHPMNATTQGQGILSRYPINEDTYWQYDFLIHSLGHQRVEISLQADLEITIYNLHPSHPGMQRSIFNPDYRFQELSDILLRAESETNPILLIGDFNMPDLSKDYAAISSQYQDTFREVGQGLGWTFPAIGFPFLRLDYVFYGEAFRAKSAQILGDNGGSDHHPLLVELLIAS